jgi:hypothetical protein
MPIQAYLRDTIETNKNVFLCHSILWRTAHTSLASTVRIALALYSTVTPDYGEIVRQLIRR